MKLNNLTPIVLSAAALCAGSISLSAATSEVVGAVSLTIPAGTNFVANPFIKPAVFQGTADAVNVADVTVAGDQSGLVGPHYVHVLSGAEQGKVYDIASVAGGAVSVITLTEATAGLAAGDSVAIRPHFKVGDLPAAFGYSLTLLDAGGAPVTQSAGFLGWTSPNVVIYPGEGFVFNSGGVTFTLTGLVSEYDVIFEAQGGTQLAGSIDPINGSAGVLASIVAAGTFGSSITDLVAGSPVVYNRGFVGWSPDPIAGVDTSNFQTFAFNLGAAPVGILNAGNVIAP